MDAPAASLLSDLFDLGISPEEKVLRSLLVFAFLVIALRLGGKRQLAQINVLDLAVVLLEDGRVVEPALRREAMTRAELGSIVRERGFASPDDVALVVLEPNGHLAVMGRESASRWRAERQSRR